jgi:hypothetical protein
MVNHSAVGETATLEIISADGRTLKTVQLAKGSTSTLLNTQSLTAGFYFLRFNNGSNATTVSFVKH